MLLTYWGVKSGLDKSSTEAIEILLSNIARRLFKHLSNEADEILLPYIDKASF